MTEQEKINSCRDIRTSMETLHGKLSAYVHEKIKEAIMDYDTLKELAAAVSMQDSSADESPLRKRLERQKLFSNIFGKKETQLLGLLDQTNRLLIDIDRAMGVEEASISIKEAPYLVTATFVRNWDNINVELIPCTIDLRTKEIKGVEVLEPYADVLDQYVKRDDERGEIGKLGDKYFLKC